MRISSQEINRILTAVSDGMIWIPGGTFRMGSDRHYLEEAPAHRVTDGFDRTSPVMSFPANGYRVYDMIGNVWEWTSDWFSQKHRADAPKACCIPENPRGGREEENGSAGPGGAHA